METGRHGFPIIASRGSAGYHIFLQAYVCRQITVYQDLYQDRALKIQEPGREVPHDWCVFISEHVATRLEMPLISNVYPFFSTSRR